MTIHGRCGGLRRVRWRGRGGWLGLWWEGLWLGGLAPQMRPERRRRGLLGFGGGWKAVVVVVVDGVANGLAPGIGAEGLTIFVLGDVDGLHEGLCEVGNGAGGAEIAGGEVVAGEEVSDVSAECFGSAGFFLGVVEAEVGMVAGARSAATAAIRERKRAQGRAVLGTESRHKSLLRVEIWD